MKEEKKIYAYGKHNFNIHLKCGCIVEIDFPLQETHNKKIKFSAKIIKECEDLEIEGNAL